MTLLLATVGFAAQPPTATWWFPMEERGRVSRRNWRVPSALDGVSFEQARRWTSTILALMAALAVTAVALTLLNQAAATRFNQHTVSPAISKPSANDLSPAAFPHISEAQQRWVGQDDAFAAAALADPTSLPTEAKTLLSHERIAMLDSIRALPPTLDRIGLAFPGSSSQNSNPRQAKSQSRLARVTVYWPEEGDYHTQSRRSSSGVRLRDGHCAVDPKVIPYGTVVSIPGIGPLVAVDTGPAVISRRAARQAGRTRNQRNAIVIDVFCSNRAKAKALAKRIEHFAVVTWQPPVRQSKL